MARVWPGGPPGTCHNVPFTVSLIPVLEWEPLLCPSCEQGRHRLATYDAAGLIGAFGDKTLNEPPLPTAHGS